jgi:hypothetical protein
VLDVVGVLSLDVSIPVLFRISSSGSVVFPLPSPTLKDSLYIPPISGVSFHRYLESLLYPGGGVGFLRLPQLFSDQGLQEADVLLIEGEDVRSFHLYPFPWPRPSGSLWERHPLQPQLPPFYPLYSLARWSII